MEKHLNRPPLGLPVPKAQRTRRRLTRTRADQLFAFGLLTPAFAIFALVIVAPILQGIWMSLHEYTLATRTNPPWNGFANYTRLIQSGELLSAFRATGIYVVGVVLLQFVLALGLALLLNGAIRGRNIYRGLLLIPWTIPSVVVALLWSWLLQPQYGVGNYVLRELGLIAPNTQWLQHPQLAMVAVIIASVWRQTPIMFVMLLAGLQSVPSELEEAARIDGANPRQVLRYITLPSIRSVIDTAMIIAVINNFQTFTIIYNMTAGGPLDRTTTLSIAAYTTAFTRFNLGEGAAIGVVWLLVLGVLVTLYNRVAERQRGETE
jgi:multiple sugar transport system permease protein